MFGEGKIRSGHAKLILIGKASAVIGELNLKDEKAYHIDVMLDLHATDKRRDCMERPGISRVFREFKRRSKDDSDGPWESFFGKSRANVFKDAVSKDDRIFHEMQHLQVYLLDPESALELELRRWADPESDEGTKKASLAIAVELLWALTKDPEPKDGDKRRYIRRWKNMNVSGASIKKAEPLFFERYHGRFVMADN